MLNIIIKTINQHGLLGLFEITETTEELILPANLTSGEHQYFDCINTDKRKREWLSVRVLLNTMLPNQHKTIAYHAQGCPYLTDHSYKISVTHSANYTAILLDASLPVGVDIQYIKPGILKSPSYFLSEQELSEIAEPNLIEKLHVYWCAKEALYKYASKADLLVKSEIYIDPFEWKGSGKMTGNILKKNFEERVLLFYEQISNYILVYTV